MNRRTFLSTALILILLALISCFNNATNPEEKKSAIIHFDFEFGDSSSEADRDSIEQLLVIVTSNELSDTIRGEFNYAESKGSFDEDIPVGIPLTISVSAYTFYGEMIFSGRTTIEKSAPKTTVTLNLQKKPPTAPADLVLPQHTLGDSVKLRWSDRSTIEHGYVIMRSVANDHQFQVIDTVEQDRQVFIDTTALENAVVYEYRVYAFNHAGLSESYVEGEVRFGNWPPAFEPGRPYSIYESSGTGDTVSIAVRATDKETELVAIRYEIDTTLFPRAQTIVFEANTFTWVSQPGDSGEFPITFIASDGYVETETMVTLSVTLANLPPIISIPQYQSGDIVSVKEGRKLQLQFSLDDPNEGQQPSFTDLKNPPWSDVNGSGSFDTLAGLFTFTPSFSAVKESDSVILDTVTLFASDNHSSEEISSFRFLLQVIDSNSAPRWVENEYAASAQERQLVSVDLKDLFDSDPEGDLVQFSSDKGSVEDTVWKYVPSYDDAGEMTVRITAEDSHTPPASSELVLTVTVADSNRAPFFVTDMPEATYLLEGDGDQLSIPVVAEDADSHDQVSVSYTVDESQFPRPNAITFSDGTFEWTSQVGDKGSFTILFLATDGKDSTVKEITLSIAGANLPPEVAIKGETQRAFSVQEGKTLTLQMIASDKNEDQAVDFIAVHNAPWADADNGEGSFDVETGIFSFTPSFTVSNRVEQGSFTNIEIVAEDSDDSPLQGTLSFEIQVVDSNRAPVNHDISLDVNENNSLSIQLQAEDADGDELLYEIIDNPSHGTASVSTLDPSIYQYLPDENFSGTDSFTCIVSDGDKVSTKATVTITVKSVNNAPRFVDPMVSSVEMDENGNRTIMFSVTDPDNTTPDVTIPLIPDWATLSNAEDTWTLRLNPTYDIASNASPTYETDLIIRILDEEDTEVFTSHTLHVSINNVNHAPTLSSSPEDARAEIGTIYTMRLAIIDEDVDGDPVEVMLTKKPDGMSVDNTTGDITWSVDRENYRAGSIETVTARVSDGYAYTDYSWDIELLPHTWQLRSEYTLEISDYPSSDKIVARDSNELYLFSQMEKIVQYSKDGGKTWEPRDYFFPTPMYYRISGHVAKCVGSDLYIAYQMSYHLSEYIKGYKIAGDGTVDTLFTKSGWFFNGGDISPMTSQMYLIGMPLRSFQGGIFDTEAYGDSILDAHKYTPFRDIEVTSQGNCFAISDSAIYRKEESGAPWNRINYINKNPIQLVTDKILGSTLYIIDTTGMLYTLLKSTNGTSSEITFSEVDLPPDIAPHYLCMINAEVGWIIDQSGNVHFTNDGFTTLRKEFFQNAAGQDIPIERIFLAADGQNMYAYGWGNVFAY